MKKAIAFITILFCSILFFGCSKDPGTTPETPEAKLARLLTGSGNRYWHLSKQLINNIQQSLTDFQKTYTKTYTVDASKTNAGFFTNSDGTSGTWTITGSVNYVESFVSAGGVGLQLNYLVNNITDNSLDIQYSANNKLVEEVYYAY